ncbi:TIGR00645 family protein [Cumulibacter soli]|uniref:TIGR00645 family protein n=1 Tax=Cumulibacter soli TaxID=2546344 RepID=UPI001067DBD2|nr:TIGR00645 family protein [Cumulibacter soli]
MSQQPATTSTVPPNRHWLTKFVGSTIFVSRWLQAPLYLGLIVAQAVYVILFWKDLIHLIQDFSTLNEEDIMLIVLGLVDVVMIANLLIMVIIGGYETFVSRINMRGHPDEPEWLSHVNPNVLKVKLAMSIIGISSIHLLKTFIEAHDIPGEVMMWQTLIHMAFILSAIGLAWIDRMSQAPARPSDHDTSSQH